MKSKTDAGVREVEVSPVLLETLKLRRAATGEPGLDDLLFPTSRGTAIHRANVSNRVLAATVERANAAPAKVALPPIREHVTNHTLRRTFASLLYEAGASPAYVMAQMGHHELGACSRGLRPEDGAGARHGHEGAHSRRRLGKPSESVPESTEIDPNPAVPIGRENGHNGQPCALKPLRDRSEVGLWIR
jgi:integrase